MDDENQDAKKRAAPAASAAAPPAKKPQATALQQQIQQQLQQQLQAQLQAAAARGQQANITPEQIQVRQLRTAQVLASLWPNAAKYNVGILPQSDRANSKSRVSRVIVLLYPRHKHKRWSKLRPKLRRL